MSNKNSFYQKLFAKVIDFSLLYVTLCLMVLAWPFSIEEAVYIYLLILTPFLWVPIEILFILLWGCTPGGAFLGIAPRTGLDQPLNFSKALRLSLFLEKAGSIRWFPCHKKLGRFLSRLALGITVLIAAIFGKAVFQFPQEFERTFGKKDSWMHYTSSVDHFSADFPGEPTVNEKQLPIPKAKSTLDYSEYRLNHTDDVSYAVSVLELPRKWRIFGSNTILKGALTVLLDNVSNSTLVSKKTVQHGGHPALEFHIQEKGNEIKGRLILVDGKLYKVEFSKPTASPAEDQVENRGATFIESFQPDS